MPVPVVVTPSFRVNVHVPVLGKPLITTLPVATLQVGCVSVPTEGVVGIPLPPPALITMLVVDEEAQLEAFVTEKV